MQCKITLVIDEYIMTNAKRNWYKAAKRKDPTFSLSTTQLVVQKLPAGLMTRVRKYCQTNGIYIRRFVAESLELGLKERIDDRRK